MRRLTRKNIFFANKNCNLFILASSYIKKNKQKKPTVSQFETRHTLIHRLKQNNENDWQIFYDSYQGYIFIIIQRMGASYHDSQELKQEIMLKAWKAIPNFEYDSTKGKFRWWLNKIVKNTVYSFMLKQKRYQDKLSNASVFQNDSCTKEFDQKIEEEWQRFVVQKAWENITEKFNELTLKCFSEIANGKSVSELSAEIDIPDTTIYVYKNRVQKQLSREIARIDYELNC